MASGKTEHYLLSQWEATDQVLRADFNADNAKIDAALKSAEAKADNAQALAQSAYTKENTPFVVGSYTGNGSNKRLISLGFTPKAVFVFMATGAVDRSGTNPIYHYGGLALQGQNADAYGTAGSTWSKTSSIIAIVDGGFLVNYNETSSSTRIASNTSGQLYSYCALK